MKILWLCTDVTGLDRHNDRIIEIGILYKDSDQADAEFHKFIKYPEYPESFKKAVNVPGFMGLTEDFLEKNGKNPRDTFIEFLEFINSRVRPYEHKKEKCIVAGYNVKFYIDFLRNFFNLNGNRHYDAYFHPMPIEVSSFVMEAVLNGWIPPLPNYKLSTVADHFNLKFEAHSAIEDIKITEQIFNIMVKLRGAE